MTTNRTKLAIAHRGLWNDEIPENSLGAFQNCVDEQVPIELDIHLLKDNTLVVFHDDNLKRMTGIDKKIKDCTFDEIKRLKLKNTDYSIPKFEDVLKLVHGSVLLDIEIKTDKKSFRICRVLAKLLDIYEGEFLIKSFNPLYIAWFRFKRSGFTRGLLVSKMKNAKLPNVIKWFLYTMKFNFLAKPQFIAYDYRDLPDKRVERLYEKGMPIYLWTIKNEEFQAPYDGIIYEKNVNKNT